MAFITPIAAFVRKHVDRIIKEVSLKKELEQQITKPGMIQISPPTRAQFHQI